MDIVGLPADDGYNCITQLGKILPSRRGHQDLGHDIYYDPLFPNYFVGRGRRSVIIDFKSEEQ